MDLFVGREYQRVALHDAFGGQRQSGICTPKAHPVILLFTGDSGERYGYRDGFQPDGTFWYTGEGQQGDMTFVAGNKAICDSAHDGRRLLLFEQVRKGWVRFLGAAEYLGYHPARGPDKSGGHRNLIVFELGLLVEGSAGAATFGETASGGREPRRGARSYAEALAELRSEALAQAQPSAPVAEKLRSVRRRSRAVRDYVLLRANGVCEACGHPAPFERRDGTPYLEPHHIHRLADEGPDDPRYVAGICPTCHRRVHEGRDGYSLNLRLADVVAEREEAALRRGAEQLVGERKRRP